MNEMLLCQSCGMTLRDDASKGTNADGSKSNDYCIHCYQNSAFTRDITMDEMIETNLLYLDEWTKESGHNMTVEQAREELKKFMPTLKRWQK